MTRASVSIVMPVLDRAAMLADALASIVGQTLPATEILVVDGGSVDGSQALVGGFPGIRLVELPGASVPMAHNAGIARASGEIVAFAASDDLLDPAALASHVAALGAEPECGMSVGLTEFFADRPHRRTPAALAGTVRRARVLEAVAVRRAVLDQHGGFREDLGAAADVEWLSRLGDAGVEVAEVERVVVRKRLHPANTTYGRAEAGHELLMALRASVLRRREVGRGG